MNYPCTKAGAATQTIMIMAPPSPTLFFIFILSLPFARIVLADNDTGSCANSSDCDGNGICYFFYGGAEAAQIIH